MTVDRHDRLDSGLREISAEGPVLLRVVGRSMEPRVHHGDRVEIAPRLFYWPGDIVAFRSAAGRILLHRLLGYVVRRRRLHAVTQGEGGRALDAPVPLDRILGRVTGGAGRAARPSPADRIGALVRLLRHAWRRRS